LPSSETSYRWKVRRHVAFPKTASGRASAAAPYPTRYHTAPFILFSNNNGSATVPIPIVAIPSVTAVTPSFPSAFLVGPGSILVAALAPILPTVVTVAVGIADANFGTTVPVDAELNLGLGYGRRGKKSCTEDRDRQ